MTEINHISNSPKIILVIIRHYLPGTKMGGPVRSISNLVEWAGNEFNFYILTSNHDVDEQKVYSEIKAGEWYPVGKAQVRYLTHEECHLSKLVHIINQLTFDVIYLDSLFESTTLSVLLLRWLKLLNRKPVILIPRGHLGGGALVLKPLKKQVFLFLSRNLGFYQRLIWHATSAEEKQTILQNIGGQTDKFIHIISNFPMPLLPKNQSVLVFKKHGHLQIIFLSRISRKKNLHFALETLRHITGSVVFDIYGPLEDERYWSECQTVIEQLPSNVQVKYCGVVPFEQTTAVMSQYDLFFLPTLHENYGHAIFEALSAGCPVLISDQTPWEGLEAAGAGWVIALDNQAGFVNVINLCVEADHDTAVYYRRSAQRYAEQYVRESMQMEQFRALFGIK